MAVTSSINDSLDNSTVGELASLTKAKPQSSDDIKDNFLNLLVAQLKNQDPTNPMQNNELTTQLAQISTVQGVEKLNKTLGAVVGQMENTQSMQTTLLINRGVMVPGDKILVGSSEENGTSTTPFGFELTRPADEVKVTIRDKNGAIVQELNFSKFDAGVHGFEWDGKNADGKEVENGAYSFTVSASYLNQALVALPLNYAVVNGVTRGEDGTKLDLGLAGTVTMDKVRQIL
ncbi:flagellar hook assembly protein FlgD [Xenorhabdus szentirmaii]|uniref:Basal-body rod modification protein FlgD n=2 Tax=Xenorhabdus szentirmaii TaxID=290112 RepID=W1J742_9GAMM|nr:MULTISPECIES: flagellar hook assembly protein FlgD [Xenorhabdus]MBD2792455.1 flagellar hook assembly protein FlgD [Xenorhabdus sp. CUL]MBD2799725.1 flagellar hook assembly protein FlgD [Xenorhabdus sp. M]MBD2805223.1 flagellar hook assembly protein FlgD [Xenorhabdus sp. ZM]MBD2824924.1 flagellar hook assembly protein FlgD [Xenorhabdus sp. 5]PHM31906.1 basal-body rod modification protein FlgD [Xenorhabdus szentirmaii DSM 16338]